MEKYFLMLILLLFNTVESKDNAHCQDDNKIDTLLVEERLKVIIILHKPGWKNVRKVSRSGTKLTFVI
jgi:hypothetical protein